jgi:hypothetical protein
MEMNQLETGRMTRRIFLFCVVKTVEYVTNPEAIKEKD